MQGLQKEHMHSFIVCAFRKNPSHKEHFKKTSRSDFFICDVYFDYKSILILINQIFALAFSCQLFKIKSTHCEITTINLSVVLQPRSSY